MTDTNASTNVSTITVAEIALPKLNRTAPTGVRKSMYRDQLAGLVAGSNQCVVEDDTSIPVEKQEQRFSSAIAQYRKNTGDRAKFTIRKFNDPVTGALRAGVWKLDGVVPFKPRATKADAPAVDGSADAAQGSTGDTDGAQG